MAWCDIESDPAVFTELLHAYGATSVQVDELWALDPAAWEPLPTIHGLIFLFKYESEESGAGAEPGIASVSPPAPDSSALWFSKQTVSNACATIAMLHVLFNTGIRVSGELEEFKQFTAALPADLRGDALGSSDVIRTAHNSFARPEPFVHETVREYSTSRSDNRKIQPCQRCSPRCPRHSPAPLARRSTSWRTSPKTA